MSSDSDVLSSMAFVLSIHVWWPLQALGCGAADWTKVVAKIQTERKDLAKKTKFLTEEVAAAAGAVLAKNSSASNTSHFHRWAVSDLLSYTSSAVVLACGSGIVLLHRA